MVVHLTSPDGRYDTLYLRNYATLQVRDVLARLPGMGDVRLFGAGDYSMRVWLDPEKHRAPRPDRRRRRERDPRAERAGRRRRDRPPTRRRSAPSSSSTSTTQGRLIDRRGVRRHRRQDRRRTAA